MAIGHFFVFKRMGRRDEVPDTKNVPMEHVCCVQGDGMGGIEHEECTPIGVYFW